MRRPASQPTPSTSVAAGALALAVVLCALAPTPAAAQAPPCHQKAVVSARTTAPDLQVVLDRLGDEEQEAVQRWYDCERGHYGVPRVLEQAVRQLDSAESPPRKLFVSAARSIELPAMEGSFPRSELIGRLKGVEAAQPHLERVLQPPAGDMGFYAVLAEVNAETHALEGWTRVEAAGTLGEARVDARDQLAAALLVLAAYLEHAAADHPEFLGALARVPVAVDAIGALWRRAETALTKAPAALGKEDGAVLATLYDDHLEATRKLFADAGREAPGFDREAVIAEGDAPRADANPPGGDEADNEEPDEATGADDEADNEEPDKADEADNKTPKAADADAGEPDKAANADADATDADADATDADAGSADAGGADAGTGQAAGKDAAAGEGLSTWAKVRLGLLGFGALLPWILLGVIALVRKKKTASWPRLANRVLAVSTFLLVLGVLFAALLMVTDGGSLLIGWDGLLALIPPYNFAILLLMLGRLDADGQLESRALIRGWAKWGSVTLAVLLVINLVVAVFSGTLLVAGLPLSQILIPVSIGAIGVGASIFMIKLWRTGDAPGGDADSDGDDGEGDEPPAADGGDDSPEPSPDEGPPPSDEELAAIEEALKAKPAPRAKKDPAAKKKDKPAAKASSGGSDVSEMSDEELGALFEAMDGDGGGGDSGGGDVPDDRKELYALLGGDE